MDGGVTIIREMKSNSVQPEVCDEDLVSHFTEKADMQLMHPKVRLTCYRKNTSSPVDAARSHSDTLDRTEHPSPELRCVSQSEEKILSLEQDNATKSSKQDDVEKSAERIYEEDTRLLELEQNNGTKSSERIHESTRLQTEMNDIENGELDSKQSKQTPQQRPRKEIKSYDFLHSIAYKWSKLRRTTVAKLSDNEPPTKSLKRKRGRPPMKAKHVDPPVSRTTSEFDSLGKPTSPLPKRKPGRPRKSKQSFESQFVTENKSFKWMFVEPLKTNSREAVLRHSRQRKLPLSSRSTILSRQRYMKMRKSIVDANSNLGTADKVDHISERTVLAYHESTPENVDLDQMTLLSCAEDTIHTQRQSSKLSEVVSSAEGADICSINNHDGTSRTVSKDIIGSVKSGTCQLPKTSPFQKRKRGRPPKLPGHQSKMTELSHKHYTTPHLANGELHSKTVGEPTVTSWETTSCEKCKFLQSPSITHENIEGKGNTLVCNICANTAQRTLETDSERTGKVMQANHMPNLLQTKFQDKQLMSSLDENSPAGCLTPPASVDGSSFLPSYDPSYHHTPHPSPKTSQNFCAPGDEHIIVQAEKENLCGKREHNMKAASDTLDIRIVRTVSLCEEQVNTSPGDIPLQSPHELFQMEVSANSVNERLIEAGQRKERENIFKALEVSLSQRSCAKDQLNEFSEDEDIPRLEAYGGPSGYDNGGFSPTSVHSDTLPILVKEDNGDYDEDEFEFETPSESEAMSEEVTLPQMTTESEVQITCSVSLVMRDNLCKLNDQLKLLPEKDEKHWYGDNGVESDLQKGAKPPGSIELEGALDSFSLHERSETLQVENQTKNEELDDEDEFEFETPEEDSSDDGDFPTSQSPEKLDIPLPVNHKAYRESDIESNSEGLPQSESNQREQPEQIFVIPDSPIDHHISEHLEDQPKGSPVPVTLVDFSSNLEAGRSKEPVISDVSDSDFVSQPNLRGPELELNLSNDDAHLSTCTIDTTDITLEEGAPQPETMPIEQTEKRDQADKGTNPICIFVKEESVDSSENHTTSVKDAENDVNEAQVYSEISSDISTVNHTDMSRDLQITELSGEDSTTEHLARSDDIQIKKEVGEEQSNSQSGTQITHHLSITIEEADVTLHSNVAADHSTAHIESSSLSEGMESISTQENNTEASQVEHSIDKNSEEICHNSDQSSVSIKLEMSSEMCRGRSESSIISQERTCLDDGNTDKNNERLLEHPCPKDEQRLILNEKCNADIVGDTDMDQSELGKDMLNVESEAVQEIPIEDNAIESNIISQEGTCLDAGNTDKNNERSLERPCPKDEQRLILNGECNADVGGDTNMDQSELSKDMLNVESEAVQEVPIEDNAIESNIISQEGTHLDAGNTNKNHEQSLGSPCPKDEQRLILKEECSGDVVGNTDMDQLDLSKSMLNVESEAVQEAAIEDKPYHSAEESSNLSAMKCGSPNSNQRNFVVDCPPLKEQREPSGVPLEEYKKSVCEETPLSLDDTKEAAIPPNPVVVESSSVKCLDLLQNAEEDGKVYLETSNVGSLDMLAVACEETIGGDDEDAMSSASTGDYTLQYPLSDKEDLDSDIRELQHEMTAVNAEDIPRADGPAKLDSNINTCTKRNLTNTTEMSSSLLKWAVRFKKKKKRSKKSKSSHKKDGHKKHKKHSKHKRKLEGKKKPTCNIAAVIDEPKMEIETSPQSTKPPESSDKFHEPIQHMATVEEQCDGRDINQNRTLTSDITILLDVNHSPSLTNSPRKHQVDSNDSCKGIDVTTRTDGNAGISFGHGTNQNRAATLDIKISPDVNDSPSLTHSPRKHQVDPDDSLKGINVTTRTNGNAGSSLVSDIHVLGPPLPATGKVHVTDNSSCMGSPTHINGGPSHPISSCNQVSKLLPGTSHVATISLCTETNQVIIGQEQSKAMTAANVKDVGGVATNTLAQSAPHKNTEQPLRKPQQKCRRPTNVPDKASFFGTNKPKTRGKVIAAGGPLLMLQGGIMQQHNFHTARQYRMIQPRPMRFIRPPIQNPGRGCQELKKHLLKQRTNALSTNLLSLQGVHQPCLFSQNNPNPGENLHNMNVTSVNIPANSGQTSEKPSINHDTFPPFNQTVVGNTLGPQAHESHPPVGTLYMPPDKSPQAFGMPVSEKLRAHLRKEGYELPRMLPLPVNPVDQSSPQRHPQRDHNLNVPIAHAGPPLLHKQTHFQQNEARHQQLGNEVRHRARDFSGNVPVYTAPGETEQLIAVYPGNRMVSVPSSQYPQSAVHPKRIMKRSSSGNSADVEMSRVPPEPSPHYSALDLLKHLHTETDNIKRQWVVKQLQDIYNIPASLHESDDSRHLNEHHNMASSVQYQGAVARPPSGLPVKTPSPHINEVGVMHSRSKSQGVSSVSPNLSDSGRIQTESMSRSSRNFTPQSHDGMAHSPYLLDGQRIQRQDRTSQSPNSPRIANVSSQLPDDMRIQTPDRQVHPPLDSLSRSLDAPHGSHCVPEERRLLVQSDNSESVHRVSSYDIPLEEERPLDLTCRGNKKLAKEAEGSPDPVNLSHNCKDDHTHSAPTAHSEHPVETVPNEQGLSRCQETGPTLHLGSDGYDQTNITYGNRHPAFASRRPTQYIQGNDYESLQNELFQQQLVRGLDLSSSSKALQSECEKGYGKAGTPVKYIELVRRGNAHDQTGLLIERTVNKSFSPPTTSPGKESVCETVSMPVSSVPLSSSIPITSDAIISGVIPEVRHQISSNFDGDKSVTSKHNIKPLHGSQLQDGVDTAAGNVTKAPDTSVIPKHLDTSDSVVTVKASLKDIDNSTKNRRKDGSAHARPPLPSDMSHCPKKRFRLAHEAFLAAQSDVNPSVDTSTQLSDTKKIEEIPPGENPSNDQSQSSVDERDKDITTFPPQRRRRGRPKGSKRRTLEEQSCLDQEQVTEQQCQFCEFRSKSRQEMRSHVNDVHFAKHITKLAKSTSNTNTVKKDASAEEIGTGDRTTDTISSSSKGCSKISAGVGESDKAICMFSNEKEGSNQPDRYFCKLCDFSESVPGPLVIHINKKHMKELTTGHCPFHNCTEFFLGIRDLMNHLNDHRNLKQYACRICGIHYKVLTSLKAHLERHKQELPYICKVCSLSFKTQGTLLRHQKLRDHLPES